MHAVVIRGRIRSFTGLTGACVPLRWQLYTYRLHGTGVFLIEQKATSPSKRATTACSAGDEIDAPHGRRKGVGKVIMLCMLDRSERGCDEAVRRSLCLLHASDANPRQLHAADLRPSVVCMQLLVGLE